MDKVEAGIWQDVKILKKGLSGLPEPVAKPFLILVSGLPGTGKSYFSRRLSEKVPIAVVETDTLRKSLFPTPLYSADESSRLFQACHLLIEDLLTSGIPVLVDATNLVERHREHIYGIADRCNAKLLIVRVKAHQEEVRERLRSRSRGLGKDGHSDADWEVYERMRSSVQAIRRNHLVVDTSENVTPVIEKIAREVDRWLKV